MARQESEREDLIREAVTYVDRIEWQIPSESEPVFTGLKKDGSLSVYFGQDPVYHFNNSGELRRAFVEGLLFRTQGKTLAKLRRERTENATELQRADLSDQELSTFLDSMVARLTGLIEAMQQETARNLRAALHERSESEFIESCRSAISPNARLAPAIATRRT
jgi:hypothetical protein